MRFVKHMYYLSSNTILFTVQQSTILCYAFQIYSPGLFAPDFWKFRPNGLLANQILSRMRIAILFKRSVKRFAV